MFTQLFLKSVTLDFTFSGWLGAACTRSFQKPRHFGLVKCELPWDELLLVRPQLHGCMEAHV